MKARNQLFAAPPYPVEQSLKRLGVNLKTARLNRNLTLEEVAQKIGTTRYTVTEAEKGNPTTGVVVYAALLWAYGLDAPLAGLADPASDEEGLALARQNKRAHPPRKINNDF